MKYQELADFLQHVGKDPSALIFEDELTAIHNRRFLLSYLEHKVDWRGGNDYPLALLNLDLDKFKRSTTATATRRATRCSSGWPISSGPSAVRRASPCVMGATSSSSSSPVPIGTVPSPSRPACLRPPATGRSLSVIPGS